jgi:hypothetical protein
MFYNIGPRCLFHKHFTAVTHGPGKMSQYIYETYFASGFHIHFTVVTYGPSKISFTNVLAVSYDCKMLMKSTPGVHVTKPFHLCH